MKVICFIPARKGSKGVPGKNKLIIEGKRLFEYTVETAISVDLFNQIVLSSDDEEILEYKCNDKRLLIQKRDSKLSQDTTPINSVVENYVLENLKSFDKNDIFVLLQPTSPIRNKKDIEKAVNFLKNNYQVDSVFSISRSFDLVPARLYKSSKNSDNFHWIESLQPETESKRRQDLPAYYFRTGSIYAVRLEALIKEKTFITKKKVGLISSENIFLNIDTELDALIAPYLIKKWKTQML